MLTLILVLAMVATGANVYGALAIAAVLDLLIRYGRSVQERLRESHTVDG